jgi:hemin uptake protein HemP
MIETSNQKGDDVKDEMTAQTTRSVPADEVRTVTARELLGARGLLRIEHEGEFYTLRITRNNRLILTK